MTALPSPPTIWFGPPAPPHLSAGRVTVQDGHFAVNGQRVTFFGVNFDFTAILSLLNSKRSSTGVSQQYLDSSQQAVMATQLDNLVAAGIRAVRIHGLDCANMPNIFASGTTTKFNPSAVEALDWFLFALEQRNLRYVIELHYTRQLVAADLPTSPSALAQECVTQCVAGAPVGTMVPWVAFDGSLQQLQLDYDQAILRHVNQFTNIAIGDSPALLAVQLENEQSLTKTTAWGEPANCPALQTAFVADATAWCGENGTTLGKFGAAQHAQYWAWRETQWLQARATNVRTLTAALVIANTYFGDAPYSSLVSSQNVGDIFDFHFYSYYGPNEQTANGGPGNGFLAGAGAPSASGRTRFGAVAAGCSWFSASNADSATNTTKPVICSEWGPVAQYKINGQFVQDPVTERSQVLSALVQAAVAQDLDALFLYSYAHSPVFEEGSIYWKPDCYDFRVDPVLMRGLAAQAATFHDLSLRPSAAQTATVTPTNGIYGAMVQNASGQNTYQQFGPYTDPALYAIPAGQKVVVAV